MRFLLLLALALIGVPVCAVYLGMIISIVIKTVKSFLGEQ